MIQELLTAMVTSLLQTLPPAQVKIAIDKALDKIEDKIKASGTRLDDILLLPMITACIRIPFGIPDNDDRPITTNGSGIHDGLMQSLVEKVL